MSGFLSAPQHLRLYGDTIHVIEDDALFGLYNLTSLELNNCGLNNMPPLHAVKSNIEILRLAWNILVNVSVDYFHGFCRLHTINLNQNKILALPNIIPLRATLKCIDFTENNIESFEPFSTNTTFPALSTLIVSYNYIGYLSSYMISCWPRLRSLDLRENLLNTLEDMSGVVRAIPLMVLYPS